MRKSTIKNPYFVDSRRTGSDEMTENEAGKPLSGRYSYTDKVNLKTRLQRVETLYIGSVQKSTL